MKDIVYFILHNLDIAGIAILLVTLVPIIKLMRELPPGRVYRRWKILVIMIFFFIGGYVTFAIGNRFERGIFNEEIIFMLLFFGALFVLLVSILSLQTALDVKRIYALEIENITDPLMGISNRRYLEKRVHEEFKKAVRYELPFSMMMLDIDHFKHINDTYGHDGGDRVLKEIGSHIQDFIRESDCVARFGGEEIVVLCPVTTADDAMQLAERLRQSIEDDTIVTRNNNQEIHITVSIGVAEYNVGISDAQTLLKHADNAMYCAKRGGRNRVVLYDENKT